eukprot:TRINITY_DN101598_c0_g1_i1.p1 TRINITY_DN101598_c0_g1~~TRINITY_DN101598_c0_g1_i1.p1  ORF type:complete len:160 (+),score=38.57 TRINITY_DN101598_c0_g1_i1:88-567(+)
MPVDGGQRQALKDVPDCARKTQYGRIMLGTNEKQPKCFTLADVEHALIAEIQKRATSGRQASEESEQALLHCKQFNTIRSETNATSAREELLRPVDCMEEGGRMVKRRRLEPFEAAQLMNLIPSSEEEATTLIPTLHSNPWLKQLIEEVQPLRAYARDV